MAGLMSADEIFEKAQNAAAAATGPDEKGHADRLPGA